jgi:hypothetical protein
MELILWVILFLFICAFIAILYNPRKKRALKKIYDQYGRTISDIKSYKDKVANYNPESDPAYIAKREELREKTEKEIESIKAKYKKILN